MESEPQFDHGFGDLDANGIGNCDDGNDNIAMTTWRSVDAGNMVAVHIGKAEVYIGMNYGGSVHRT